MRTRSRKATSNQAPSSGRRSSLRVRAAASLRPSASSSARRSTTNFTPCGTPTNSRSSRTAGGSSVFIKVRGGSLAVAPALDLGQRRLARQAVVVRQGQQEFLAAGRREREVGLPQLRRAAAPRRLAALAFEAGVDAVLESRDVVVGKIGTQRRADDLARAACGLDEGVAQTFERAAGGVGEGKCHDADYVMANVSLQWRLFPARRTGFLHDVERGHARHPCAEPRRDDVGGERLRIALDAWHSFS